MLEFYSFPMKLDDTGKLINRNWNTEFDFWKLIGIIS